MTPPDAPKNILMRIWAWLKKAFMRIWAWARGNPIVAVLAALLVILLAFFLIVVIREPEWFYRLSGIANGDKRKFTALKSLGIAMGGVILAIQAANSHRRAVAMEESARAQVRASEAQADAAKQQAEANRNAEKGLRQERLKNAIEHLGNPSPSIRMGGAYELFHLAEDTEEWRWTIFDILCAHIRRTTGEPEYREKHKEAPSEEIQSLLTLLFVQEHEVFNGLHINLQGSWLNGANLEEARLQKAILSEAHLQGALLDYAHFQGAVLRRVYLQGADLFGAQLQGAELRRARLQGADLSVAELQGANLWDAHLQGAISGMSEPRVEFAERMMEQIGQPSELFGVVFAGGLSKQDMDALVKGLSDEEARVLRGKLEPRIDKPKSHELPENSGAITGAYSKEQAEEWIAEYEAAMAEVPKKDAG